MFDGHVELRYRKKNPAVERNNRAKKNKLKDFVYETTVTRGELWELFYCFIIMIRQAATNTMLIGFNEKTSVFAMQVGLMRRERKLALKMLKKKRDRDNKLNSCDAVCDFY